MPVATVLYKTLQISEVVGNRIILYQAAIGCQFFINIILMMFEAKLHKESSRGGLSNKSLDRGGWSGKRCFKYFTDAF